MPDTSWEVANLPFSIGGLGLRSAPRLSTAACWASWADCLHTVQLRHPQVGEMMSTALTDNSPGRHLEAAVTCRKRLLDVGFEAPSWEYLQRGAQPRQNELDDAEPGIKKHGWQFGSTQKVEDCFLSGAMWPRLSPPSRALLRSQGGPMAWLSWPSPRSLRHRGGVLGWRGFALESAAASVCREAGARVSLNVRVQDMDLARPNILDNRRLEIVADGLPLFMGAQFAVDTTIVSILKRDGSVRTRCATVDGASLEAACRRKEATYPKLTGRNGRTKLVVLGCEVGGRWSGEVQEFLHSLAKAKARSEPAHLLTTARQTLLLRPAVMLACSAAKAVALSLLERPGGLGSHGATPTTSEVIGEARYT